MGGGYQPTGGGYPHAGEIFVLQKKIWQLARLSNVEDALHFVIFCTCQRNKIRLTWLF